MIAWILLAVWLIGWMYGSRLVLRAWMEKILCSKGEEFLSICRTYHPKGCAKSRGEIRPRFLTDTLAAFGIGFTWPVLVLAHLLSATTPVTPGESRRIRREQESRIAEQAAEIARLERQIGIERTDR